MAGWSWGVSLGCVDKFDVLAEGKAGQREELIAGQSEPVIRYPLHATASL